MFSRIRMEESKFEQIRTLLYSLLECRQENKLLIVSLCDRGQEQLNNLSRHGPDFIRFLDQIEDERRRFLESSKVSDDYLSPVECPQHAMGRSEGTTHCQEHRRVTRSLDRYEEKASREDKNHRHYQSLCFPGGNREPAPAQVYQSLASTAVIRDLESGTGNSFSVIGYGTLPASELPGGGKHASTRSPEQRYVNDIEQINGLKRACLLKDVEIEQLQKQLHELKDQKACSEAGSSNKQLVEQVQKLLFEKHQNDAELAQLKKDKEDLTLRNQTGCSEAGSSNKQLVEQVQKLLFEKHQNDAELAQLKKDKEDLTLRLSKELSSKVSADESDLENINIRNRPMNIAADYSGLCSGLWLDAKNELDKYSPDTLDRERLRLLRKILMISQETAAGFYKRLLERTEQNFCQPLSHLKDIDNIDSGFMPQVSDAAGQSSTQFPTPLANAIGDFLRREADKVDYRYLTQEIRKCLLTKTSKKLGEKDGAFSNKSVQRYLQECARLAWKLQLQRPPLKLDDKTGLNEKWNRDEQEVYFSSMSPTGEDQVVQYYVHPALLHNRTILVKGRVYVDRSTKNLSVA